MRGVGWRSIVIVISSLCYIPTGSHDEVRGPTKRTDERCPHEEGRRQASHGCAIEGLMGQPDFEASMYILRLILFAVHTMWILMCMCLTVCAFITTSSHSYVNVSILGGHLGSHRPLQEMT